MKKYVIIADSTCDLDADLLKQHNIDYAKMGYVVDEKEYPAFNPKYEHSTGADRIIPSHT